MMKLDILAFGAHPDDIELSCSGTILKHIAAGKRVGVVDLTEGQLGSRGSVELRYKEAAASSKILGLHARENLQMEDGFFQNDPAHQRLVIQMIRKYKPDVVLTNAPADRHPDHGRACALVSEACFYAGLLRIETEMDGVAQDHWRPKAVYHYVQDNYMKPDFVVDISDHMEKKRECIAAFSSQFYNPKSDGPETPISSKDFMDFIDGRARQFGRGINAKYGEGFIAERLIGVSDITELG
jgi:bacillithiol biosynthesis deacetylase BshB1